MAGRLAAAVVLLSAAGLDGQTARLPFALTGGTGSIRGRVRAAESGTPLRNARVELEDSARRAVATVLADGEGRFAITALNAGVYALAVAKAGYVRTRFVAPGDPRPGSTGWTPIRVADGATIEGLDVRLAKAAAIAGRVVDGFGDPVVGASVTADSAGDQGRTSAAGETDDLGEYRIGNLPAGAFIVSVLAPPAAAIISSGPPQVMAARRVVIRGPGLRLYYPAAGDATQAQPVEVLASEERSNLDFTLAPSQLPNDVFFGDLHAATNLTAIRRGGPEVVSQAPGVEPLVGRDATGEIKGRVIRGDGRPLTRAQVRLELTDAIGTRRETLTDDDGRYEFTALRPGDYTVTASKRGYLDVEFGQARAFEHAAEIELSGGQKRERVEISLPRLGTIAGHLLDENGEPVEGARVAAFQIRFVAGRQQLVEALAPIKWTDDRGSFRVHGLQPGQYLVRASLGDSSDHSRPMLDIPGYAPTFFPGVPTPAGASFVTVGIAEDVGGLDFAMARVPTARISGRAFTSTGEPVKGGLSLTPSLRSGSLASTPAGPATLLTPDGSFEFRNVPPGEYVIRAMLGGPAAAVEFAAQFVAVNGTDISGLLIRTTPGSTISGRVTFEGDNPPRPLEIDLRPVPVDPDSNPRLDLTGPLGSPQFARAEVHEDWTFQIAGVSGARKLRLANPPAGWALKAIYLNGSDVTDQTLLLGRPDQSMQDLQVVVSNQVTTIGGAVFDASGRTVGNCLVVAFTSDREARAYPSRFLDYSHCERDGSFLIRRLPPGEYLLAALPRRSNETADEWQDPQRLESITPGATRIVLTEGQKLSANLRRIAR